MSGSRTKAEPSRADPLPIDELFTRIERSEFHRWSGITLEEAEPGRVVMRMKLEPHHHNPQGIAHGGALAGLLDSVCGLALRTLLPANVSHRTIHLNITYMRPGVSGYVTAVGKAIHSGRTIGHSEGEAFDEDGRLMARATATFFNLPAENPL